MPMDAEPCGAAAASRESHHIPSCFQNGDEAGTLVGKPDEAPQTVKKLRGSFKTRNSARKAGFCAHSASLQRSSLSH